jgi:chromosome segregation ATPase
MFAVLLTALVTTGLVACSDDTSDPETQLEQALDAADDQLDEAASAIDQIESKKDQLGEAVDSAQEQLKATAEKQVNLWKSNLDAFKTRITDLPAEQEQQFSGRLQQLQTGVQQLEDALGNYTDQGADAATDAWQQVKSKLDELARQFESFTRDLDDAAGA